jgi:hypothetical protein
MLACVFACLTPHEVAIAAQSPRSITPQLQEQFGLNEAQVRGALGALESHSQSPLNLHRLCSDTSQPQVTSASETCWREYWTDH